MLIGIFSDAHGHVGGFDLAINVLGNLGASRLFFLGDSIGYIPNTCVVRRLMSNRHVKAIKGNHEAMMLSGAPVEARRSAVYQLDKVMLEIKPEELAFLRSLPTERRLKYCGAKFLFVHGSPNDPTFGYVYPDTDLSVFSDIEADVIFMGNTHHPFVRKEFGKIFINVGSCGLPRDNDPRGCACLYDTQQHEAKLIRYSISAESRSLLAENNVADSVSQYLRRYASTDEGV